MEIGKPATIGVAAVLAIAGAVWLTPSTTPKSGGRPAVSAPAASADPAPEDASAAPDPEPADADPADLRLSPPLETAAEAPSASERDDTYDMPSVEIAERDPEQAFEAGYRWAAQRGLERGRACRAQASHAARAGCRQYLADNADRPPLDTYEYRDDGSPDPRGYDDRRD